MTIKELYEWAKNNNVEDADIVVHDSCGDYTNYIEPTINTIGTVVEVEL